jgi:hypothetical protein
MQAIGKAVHLLAQAVYGGGPPRRVARCRRAEEAIGGRQSRPTGTGIGGLSHASFVRWPRVPDERLRLRHLVMDGSGVLDGHGIPRLCR